MKLSNLFSKTPGPEGPTPEQILRRMVDYMPEYYVSGRHFKDCLEYLEHHEWAPALDSLIQLTEESGHYFAEDFWLGLADAATKMKLNDKADYCHRQITRNLEELKFKTPFGYTNKKLDDTHFEYRIAEKKKKNGPQKGIRKMA